MFIPNLLPENRVRPLEWVTADPQIETTTIGNGDNALSADVYSPGGNKQVEKILLLIHGANEKGKDDARIINFGQSLARAGITTIIPTFPDILRSRFTPAAADQIAVAARWIKEKYPQAEIGMISFSVANGPMFIATAKNNLEPNLLFAFGGYYDLKNVLKYAFTGEFEFEGQIFHHDPDPFAGQLILDLYENSFGPEPNLQILAANKDPAKFDELYQQLSDNFKQFITDLSPAHNLDQLRAKKILLAHSQPDLVIPHTESLRLKQVLGERAELTILQIFSHVNIDLPPATPKNIFSFYIPEASKLYQLVFRILNF